MANPVPLSKLDVLMIQTVMDGLPGGWTLDLRDEVAGALLIPSKGDRLMPAFRLEWTAAGVLVMVHAWGESLETLGTFPGMLGALHAVAILVNAWRPPGALLVH